METHRNLIIAASRGYTPRSEMFEGREHLVVPVVALVEGVVFAMNAKNGPEFVPDSVYHDAPERWDNKPLFEGHPLVDGKPVRGDTKFMREQRAIGLVRNPTVDESLNMEAWLDVERATKRSPELIARARAGEPIEISVGVLVAADKEAGEYKGKAYGGVWKAYDPDHLALLPEGIKGACSLEMGCGVRAMQDADDVYGYEENEMDIEGLRDISQDVRDKMDKGDFAGPNESFPIEMPVDVSNAAKAIGRAKGNRADIKRKVISIAYRKGSAFVAHLPEDWKKKSDMKAASSFATFMETVKAAFRPAQDASEMGNNDLRRKLYDALREVEANIINVEDFYPVTDPSHVVYTCYDGENFGLYERPFTLATSGVVTVGDMRVQVESVTHYEPVEGATPTALEQNPGQGAPNSDNTETPKEESTMKSEKVTKFLESATECQIKALEAFVEGGAKPAEAAVAAVVRPEPTEAELKALADARAKEITDAVDAGIKTDRAQREAESKKSDTIKVLSAFKNQPFTAEQLAAKTQAELDSLVAFAEKVAPAASKEVRAAVDFGGNGAPKVGDNKNEVPDAPDMTARILAARKK